jgi:hypothetical protein
MLKITDRCHLYRNRGYETREDLTFLTLPIKYILTFSKETEKEEKIIAEDLASLAAKTESQCPTSSYTLYSYVEGFKFLPETAVKK